MRCTWLRVSIRPYSKGTLACIQQKAERQQIRAAAHLRAGRHHHGRTAGSTHAQHASARWLVAALAQQLPRQPASLPRECHARTQSAPTRRPLPACRRLSCTRSTSHAGLASGHSLAQSATLGPAVSFNRCGRPLQAGMTNKTESHSPTPLTRALHMTAVWCASALVGCVETGPCSTPWRCGGPHLPEAGLRGMPAVGQDRVVARAAGQGRKAGQGGRLNPVLACC